MTLKPTWVPAVHEYLRDYSKVQIIGWAKFQENKGWPRPDIIHVVKVCEDDPYVFPLIDTKHTFMFASPSGRILVYTPDEDYLSRMFVHFYGQPDTRALSSLLVAEVLKQLRTG